jgi:Zn-dependent protease
MHLADALLYFAVFLLSTTLHEAAHAWVAMKGGDLTAYHGGQVSLDPLPHIRREPFGMVILPLLSAVAMGWPVGYASAPYDQRWARLYPRRAAVMALAGPAANLLLVVVAVVLLRIGAAAGVFFAPQRIDFGVVTASDAGATWEALGQLLSVLFSLNLLLFAFNLLPVPPLDGSGALPLFMRRSTTEKYQTLIWHTPALSFIGLVLAWRIFPVMFAPIFTAAASLIYPGVRYG